MGGQKTRNDYITSAMQWVDTGADVGLLGISVKSPEAKMLENQHRQHVMAAHNLRNQEMGIKAAGMIYQEVQGTRQDMVAGFETVDASLNAGFDRVDSTLIAGFSQVDDTLNQGFNQIDGTLSQGFYQVGNELSQGFNQVDGSLNQGFNKMDGTLSHGFNRMDSTLTTGFSQVDGTLAHGFDRVDSSLNRVDGTLQNGFLGVARGLSAIDADLTRGFSATVDALHTQTGVLDNRLVEVGKTLVGRMADEGHMTRSLIHEVGKNFVTALENEGNLTRETILEAAEATISSLEQEGAMTREVLLALRASITRNFEILFSALTEIFHQYSAFIGEKMDTLSDKLSRQGEMKSREHVRVALGFFRAGMSRETLKALDRATEAFDGYFPAIFLRGVVAFLEGRYYEAERCFKAAIAQAGLTDPEKVVKQKSLALLMLGRLRVVSGDWEGADRIFSELGDFNPSLIVAVIEQSYAIFQNNRRGKVTVRVHKIANGFSRLSIKNAILAWYGLALLLADRFPKEAASAFSQAVARHRSRTANLNGVHVIKVLRELYPSQIRFLYRAVMDHRPELRWLFSSASV